jgi:hypothetical protein
MSGLLKKRIQHIYINKRAYVVVVVVVVYLFIHLKEHTLLLLLFVYLFIPESRDNRPGSSI